MKRSTKPVLKQMVLVAATVLLGASAVLAWHLPGFGKGDNVSASNGVVSIPVSKVSDGKAHFYRFAVGGKEIGFFLVKGADGVIRTAYDACDVCFPEKKGYVQDGDFMQCKNCGKKFAITQIGPHTAGGCNPSYLPATRSGANIVISANALKAGARFF